MDGAGQTKKVEQSKQLTSYDYRKIRLIKIRTFSMKFKIKLQ